MDTSTRKKTLISKIHPKHQEKLQAMLTDGETIEASAPADLSLKGDYDDLALAITSDRIIAFDPAHPHGVKEIPIDQVEKVILDAMYSNFLFKVQTKDAAIDLSRFTYSARDLFDALCQHLASRLGEENVLANGGPEGDHQERARCPSCGRSLRRKNAICPYCIDKRKVIIRLLSYIKPHWKLALVCVLFAFIATAASLAPPYFTQILIDEVVLEGDLNLLWIVVSILVMVHIVHSVFNGLALFHVRSFSEKIIYDLRTQVFRKMQKLAVKYFDKRSTGSIMSRVSNDTQQLREFIVQASRNIAIQVLTLIIIGVVMFSMHWQLALLTLLPIPLVTISARIFVRKVHPVYHRVWRRRSLMNSILGDSIPGIRVIKAFTGEERQNDFFSETTESLLNEQLRAARMASMFTPIVTFLMMMGGVIIWGLGGYWVITRPDTLSLGVLVAFISYAQRFFGPVQFLANLSDMLQQATTSAERVFEMLDVEPEANLGKGKKLEKIRGELEFKNVSFHYEQDKPVLQDINLKIKPGETIGMVGQTGSGKSTFANLLLRFYEPIKGRITLDGIDLDELDLQFLRDNTGFVLQEPLLFRDTIARNIAYSRPDSSTADIIQAAKAANAHDFICEFPDAYDTRVGERGVGLSGGERQRVSIARAIIKNPSLLILDEATASVDTEVEHLIQEAIDRLVQNRTTIIIAHRLSTLRNADRIVVLDDGKIAEVGTHDELMAKKGIFHKLIKLQTDIGADMLTFSQED